MLKTNPVLLFNLIAISLLGNSYKIRLIIVTNVPVLANNASCRKCYVCGTGENSCDNFNSSNEYLFIKECPPGSQSCSTHSTDEEG